jgi:hypothetical protein
MCHSRRFANCRRFLVTCSTVCKLPRNFQSTTADTKMMGRKSPFLLPNPPHRDKTNCSFDGVEGTYDNHLLSIRSRENVIDSVSALQMVQFFKYFNRTSTMEALFQLAPPRALRERF